MNYTTPGGLAGAGQDLRNIAVPTAVRPPSLVDRLQHLERGVEEAQRLRSRLERIADQLEMRPEVSGTGNAAPSPSDLNGKFGEAIGFLHVNLTQMHTFITRIEASLFGDEKAVVDKAFTEKRA